MILDWESLRLERGIGKIIGSPESTDLIEGVKIDPLALHPDDRGYFLEVARVGKKLVTGWEAGETQISAALSYAGTIKAFHYHHHQTDVWAPVSGLFQVALVDLRKDSPTHGRRNTIYAGALRPWQILIPPGVGHGYKALGDGPSLLVYLTNRFYNPADEGRIAYDHPGIHYDWELQHK
jgi:dTDP-4-dehydrorhamnose 3,5-epimerase